jgi:hypothetical protein
MNDSSREDPDQIFDEGSRIDEAIEQGFRDAVRRHRQGGVPMVFWEKGRCVWVSPDEIELGDTPNETNNPNRA